MRYKINIYLKYILKLCISKNMVEVEVILEKIEYRSVKGTWR